LLEDERAGSDTLAHLVASCDDLQAGANFAAFSEHLAQSPFAELYANVRAAVLREDIDEEPATQEFDAAITKMLAEPLRRELDTLQSAVVGGTADDAAKARMRWLVSEINRRRQLA
jgi:DNA primase